MGFDFAAYDRASRTGRTSTGLCPEHGAGPLGPMRRPSGGSAGIREAHDLGGATRLLPPLLDPRHHPEEEPLLVRLRGRVARAEGAQLVVDPLTFADVLDRPGDTGRLSGLADGLILATARQTGSRLLPGGPSFSRVCGDGLARLGSHPSPVRTSLAGAQRRAVAEVTGPPGFEPGSEAPEASVMSKLYYGPASAAGRAGVVPRKIGVAAGRCGPVGSTVPCEPRLVRPEDVAIGAGERWVGERRVGGRSPCQRPPAIAPPRTTLSGVLR